MVVFVSTCSQTERLYCFCLSAVGLYSLYKSTWSSLSRELFLGVVKDESEGSRSRVEREEVGGHYRKNSFLFCFSGGVAGGWGGTQRSRIYQQAVV